MSGSEKLSESQQDEAALRESEKHYRAVPEAVGVNDAYKVTFGQGDWTCTLSRLTGTTNVSMEGMNGKVIEAPNNKSEIEVCTVMQRKNGEIVEQKVFYDLVGMQKQIEVI